MMTAKLLFSSMRIIDFAGGANRCEYLSMNTTSQESSPANTASAFTWTDEEIDKLFWAAGVVTKISVYGFLQAATEAFRERGYRLATICQDIKPFQRVHKLSLYTLGDQPRLGRQDAKSLGLDVMREIGIKPEPEECWAEVSGKRLVFSVGLPRWAWPKL